MKKSKTLQKIINKLAENSFKEGKMMENQVTKAIKILKSQPRLKAIQALKEYLKQIKRRQRQHTMYIETAIPLSSTQIRKVKKFVEKKVRITKVLTNIDPQILGGFRLQVGDNIYDESILGKINQVKEAIISGGSGE